MTMLIKESRYEKNYGHFDFLETKINITLLKDIFISTMNMILQYT